MHPEPTAQERLRAIFEQTAVGLAETDLDGRFVLVNDRYCAMVGRSRQELLGGLTMQSITHPDDLPRNLELFADLLSGGRSFEIEKRYLRPDGSHLWVRNTVSRIDDADGPSFVLAVSQDITLQRLAETNLRASEARYRRIFETAGVSIWEEDFSEAYRAIEDLRARGVRDLGRYLDENPGLVRELLRSVRIADVNDQTVRLFEAADKAELLESLESVFVEESLAVFRDELVAIFEGQRIHTGAARLRTLTGKRRDVLFALRIPSDPAEFSSMPVALIDVTERRRAEAEAQQVRTDLYRMLMQSPVPTAVISGAGLTFELANAAYRQVVGGRELVGKGLLEALPELEGQGYDNFLRDVMASGEAVTAEESLLMLERDGRLQPTYWTFIYAPLRNEDGTADRVMATCNDVTAQVLAREERDRLLSAEQAARAEAEAAGGRFVDLVNGLDAIVWEADAETFRFSFVSQRAEHILGYPVSRWTDEPDFWANHIHPDDRNWAVELCRSCSEHGDDHEFEYRMVAADGRTVWLRDLVHVVEENSGAVKLLRGVMVDVTARKEAEQAREAFVGVLSHELRTPVTTILGAAEYLLRRDGSVDSATSRDLLDDVAAEARRLSRLVEDLLVLSRSEREQLMVDAEPVLIQHAVRATIAVEGERYPNVEFTTDMSALPPVAADRTYLEQVLRNLLSNAAKYGPDGPARVHLSAEQLNGRVVVRVLDEGIGFAPDEADRLFGLFYRAATAKRRPGAGIGLYVTRALVESMGGKAWAKPREGRGSEFGFWLPVATAANLEDGRQTGAGPDALLARPDAVPLSSRTAP